MPTTEPNNIDPTMRLGLASGKRKMSAGPWRHSCPQRSPLPVNSLYINIYTYIIIKLTYHFMSTDKICAFVSQGIL